jgi:hypothetical protein
MRMLNLAWRKSFVRCVSSWLLVAALAAMSGWVIYNWKGTGTLSAIAGVAIGLLVLGAGFWITRLADSFARIRLANRIDDVFRQEYRGEIEIGTHDDLVKTWEEIRGETAKIIQSMPLRLPLFGGLLRNRLENVRKRLDAVGRS